MTMEKSNKKSTGNETLDNTASALSLLKEWLSISESQICSTEVLSEQLPQVNKLLEDSMNSISTHFGVLSENTQKIAKEIAYIDEALDIVKIGGKDIAIPKHLEDLAKSTSDKKTAKALMELSKKIKSQEKDLHAELKKATSVIKDTSSEISEIVVGMQFQDRVSQNIMITINIMQAIVSYLEREIEISLPNITRQERRKLLNKDFAKEILQTFRLGELQLSFVNHLIEHGYIKNAEEIGFSIEAHEKNEASDGIDLF